MVLGVWITTPCALADDFYAWGKSPEMGDEGLAEETETVPPTIEELICSYSWPCDQALRVARCESTMRPTAYNAGSYGLFQIQYASHARRVGGPAELLYDPEINVRIAHEIWAEQSWRPWACRP